MTEPSHSDRRRAIEALSLDRSEPFLGDLGLSALPPERVRDAFRPIARAIVENTAPPPEIEILQRVQTTFEPAFARAFAALLPAIDLGNDQNFNIWAFRLAEWSRKSTVWAELTEGAPSISRLREACAVALDDTALLAKLETAAERPLSDWDLWLYAACSFDDDGNDPMMDLVLITQRLRLLAFWRQVHVVPPDERERFFANAQRMNAAAGRSSHLAPLEQV